MACHNKTPASKFLCSVFISVVEYLTNIQKNDRFTKICGCNDFYLNIFPILLTVNWWTMKGLGIYSSILFLKICNIK